MHTVHAAQLRAQVVQSEFRRMGVEYLPYIHEAIDTLPRRVKDLIARKRPAEAEHYLRSAEALTGVISHKQFETYMSAVVRHPDDRSWT